MLTTFLLIDWNHNIYSHGCYGVNMVHHNEQCPKLSFYFVHSLKKRAHTGCTPPKIMHPAVEMCTPGAGCTLNFGH